MHHRHVRQHVPARVHDLQVRAKVAARLQTFHLAHRLSSRAQHCAVQRVLDGVVAGADLPVGLRPADQEVPGVVGHGILSLGAQRAVSRQLAVAAERRQAEVEARSGAVLLVEQRGQRLSRGSALPGRGVKGRAGSEVSQRPAAVLRSQLAGLQSGRPRGRDCWPGR